MGEKRIMRRQAADNAYLHKDFHAALSCGLEYLHEHYGEEAVREFLRDFTRSYFAPLKEDLCRRGLAAMKEHLARIYRMEGATVTFREGPDELIVEVSACPAVTHMRSRGYPVARLFHETTRTVDEALCEGTPYAAELLEYDAETGRSVRRFLRRTP